MSERRAIDLTKLTEQQVRTREELGLEEQVASSGLNNQSFIEPVPDFDVPSGAKVIKNNNNAWIVLGRDMPGDITSGYGGKGHTGAAAIDIVAGRMASVEGGPDSNAIVANNYFTDAARITVSQKTDIDKNFALVGNTQSEARSGIGIKADAVRLIGREGVKIVTGKGKNLEGTGDGGEKNSQGGTIEKFGGIELIAGNDVSAENLEPIVKAYALNDTLTELVERIQDLSDIVTELAKAQTKINNALAQHTHEVPQAPTGVTKSTPPLVAGVRISSQEAQKMSNVHQNLYKHKMNLGTAFVETRLSPTGKKWFGSRFNKTN